MTHADRRRPFLAACLFASALLSTGSTASAEDLRVAVASNFTVTMQRVAAAFAKDTGYKVLLSAGATGTLFAQIENGAPFAILLAADEATPRRLEHDGFAIAGTRFTYAVGSLVLWSARPGYVDPNGVVLAHGAFQHLALANPKLAPYGAAAREVLTALGLLETLRPRLVEGENVAQTHEFVASGVAELGFVARSQVTAPGSLPSGSLWVVPARLYAPIRQDAVVLRAAHGPAASALCSYLRGPKAAEILRAYGYEAPP